MAAGIRLLETLVLEDPPFWSYRSSVWMQIETQGSAPEAAAPAIGLAGRDERSVVFADRVAKVGALVDIEGQKEARA